MFKKQLMLGIIFEARTAAINPAIKVKRILPFRLRRMVGPFIFMDHEGPIVDVWWTPEDWKRGRIILPPNDNKEFIPLPDDKTKPAGGSPKPGPLS